MNSTATTQTSDQAFSVLSIALVDPSPTNPRKTFDQQALEELAASIAEKGVLQPALVRPHPSDSDRYELVCGERRYRASLLSDQKLFPAVIRELDDAAVLELQLAENNQREDVTPLEEADAMRQLQEDHNRSPEEIAAKLGRSQSYVYRRLSLTKLIAPLRALLEQERIGLVAAEMLSQAPEELQSELSEDRLHMDAEDFNGQPTTWSTHQVRSLLSAYTRRMEHAPWDLEASFGSLSPCHQCSERSGSQPALLASLDNSDRCLNKACWEQKKTAWWKVQTQQFKDQGLKVLAEDTSADLFDHFWNQSEWVVASDTNYREPKHRTWDELAPSNIKRFAALRPTHSGPTVVTLIRRQDIVDKLLAAGRDELANQCRPRSSSSGKTAAQREAENQRRERRRQRIGEIVSWVEDQPTFNKTMLLELAEAVIKKCNVDELRETRRRRGLEKGEGQYATGRERQPLLDLLEDSSIAEIFGLLVELQITWTSVHYTPSEDSSWATWANLAGVNADLSEGDDE